MSDFVLTCESAADRTREFFASRNIPVVCFHYEIDDVVYTDDLYQSITPDKFFAQIAAGAMPKTSQVSVGEYEEFWEPFVAEGKDVLHLTLSSGISGTYGSACVAAQMLADRYPQGDKVHVIDSLSDWLAYRTWYGGALLYGRQARGLICSITSLHDCSNDNGPPHVCGAGLAVTISVSFRGRRSRAVMA